MNLKPTTQIAALAGIALLAFSAAKAGQMNQSFAYDAAGCIAGGNAKY